VIDAQSQRIILKDGEQPYELNQTSGYQHFDSIDN